MVDFVKSAVLDAKRVNADFKAFNSISEQFVIEGTGPLDGYAVTVKDCLCTKDLPSTGGSKILSNYTPGFDATCVERVRKAGGFVVGKTTQDEFGFGSFNVNTLQVPLNPVDNTRVTGGSSGGAACATKALTTRHVAIAESTGGSISCPASFCGVVGITPSYGVVSRWGMIDYASSLDKIGTMGKTVDDAAKLLSVIAGRDLKDMTSVDKKWNFSAKHTGKIRVGVPKIIKNDPGIDSAVKRVFFDSISKLEKAGVITVEEVELPSFDLALAGYYVVAMSEASSNLAKLVGTRFGAQRDDATSFPTYNEYFAKVRGENFGEEAKRRIILGAIVSSSGRRGRYYQKALAVREHLACEYAKIYERFDVIAAPAMPCFAPKFEEVRKMTAAQVYALDYLTVPWNFTLLPHISIPMKSDLPIGLSLTCARLEDEKLIAISRVVEEVLSK